jgi:hypothetical protein
MVKADTIDVNVAGSLRFTQKDWAATADVVRRELAGVQLVDDRQVRLGCGLCLGASHRVSTMRRSCSEAKRQTLPRHCSWALC